VGDAVRTVLRGTGQLLITVGVVVLLFCVYLLQVTGLQTAREQDRLEDQLAKAWAEPARPALGPEVPDGPVVQEVALGEGFAVLRVPALDGYEPWVVVEGTSVADLKDGPGHIPGTALPGELGNVVISGHRTTYGAPFKRFGELRPGDEVVLETRDRWFTYEVRRSDIVAPTAVEVTLPVPGRPGAEPTEALLTLTTCHPEYSARERLVVQAGLVDARDKTGGPPPALALSAEQVG
jgi:sortase A